MAQITEEDKKILEQFPKYDDKPEHWVGSRDYWQFIFEEEKNRDPELHKKFGELHHKLVNEVIKFCKENNLEVDEVHLGIDGIMGSRDWGEWTCCTDSSMSMYTFTKNEGGISYVDRKNPFLFQI